MPKAVTAEATIGDDLSLEALRQEVLERQKNRVSLAVVTSFCVEPAK